MALGPVDTKFVSDPLAFMKKFAALPTDYDSQSLAGMAIYDKGMSATKTDDLMTIERRERQIAFTRFEEIAGVLRSRKNGYKLVFLPKGKLKHDISTYIPMWFLPWASNRLTSMRLPPKIPLRPGAAPAHNRAADPDIFFTAAINGCSVIVHGDPKSPTVSHGGTTDPRSKTHDVNGHATEDPFLHGNARLHWSELHKRYFGGAPGFGTTAGISAGDYINTMQMGNTPEAMEYKKFLSSTTPKSLRISHLQAQGCVFGLRDSGGNWSFYLQKNIELTVTRMKKKHGFFGDRVPAQKGYFNTTPLPPGMDPSLAMKPKQIFTEDSVQLSIPINVVKFFPGGKDSGTAHAMLDKNTVKAMCESALA